MIELPKVSLPEGCTLIDCRAEDSDIDLHAIFRYVKECEVLHMSENDLTMPASIQTYYDLRKDSAKISECINHMLYEGYSSWKNMVADYQEAASWPQDLGNRFGGSGCYKPIAISVHNYGVTIICDQRSYMVRPFVPGTREWDRDFKGAEYVAKVKQGLVVV